MVIILMLLMYVFKISIFLFNIFIITPIIESINDILNILFNFEIYL